MRFSLSSAGLQEWNGDVLAVGLPQGDADATATALEQRFAGITEALKQQEFKGKPGDQLVITPLGGGPQRLVVLGLGESDGIDAERLRGAAARAAKAAIGCEGSLGLHLPWAGTEATEAARICAEAVSYTHLRAHETLRYLVCRLLLDKKKTSMSSRST